MFFTTNTGVSYSELTETILRDRITYGEFFGITEKPILRPFLGNLERSLTAEEIKAAKDYICSKFSKEVARLYYPEFSGIGQFTMAYINKLNTLYPSLDLNPDDTIENATVKLTSAGVSLEEVDTLLGWYERGM